MGITLSNFKEHVEPTILLRGLRYYDDDRVDKLEELTPGYWRAIGEGSRSYHVGITITADGGLGWACSCPYDQGPLCKHVAAALYALEAAGSGVPAKKTKPRKKRKTRADKGREALGSLSGEELHDLLLELALDDRELAGLILARYGPETDSVKGAARLVRDALRLGQDRHGFIDYYGASRVAKSVSELLGRAEVHFEGGRPSGENN